MILFLFFFFFSSRRRHTRSLRDWSSDVCSSDLSGCCGRRASALSSRSPARRRSRSEERRVGKGVDLGGRRIIKKKKKKKEIGIPLGSLSTTIPDRKKGTLK